MFDSLYHARVLELAGDIPCHRALPDPDGSAERISKICGSRVRVEVALNGEVISDIGLDVQACALGQASASILARGAIGANIAEIQLARDQLFAMLKSGSAAPTGRFWELRHLAGVQDYPARHVSTLLAFDAALDAIAAAKVNAKP